MTAGFAGKVALVTGGSSGIGKATALEFAKAGASVVAVGRRTTALEEVVGQIVEQGGRAIAVTADVTKAADRERAVQRAVEEFGGLNALVNAAGIIEFGTLESTSLDDWQRMFDVNVVGVFHLMQLALPHLEKARGAIVNVSSVNGMRSFPGVLAYCSSKSALDQLTRCAALELASRGVRVNAVNPGVVVSGLHRTGGLDESKYAAFLEHSKTTHPMGRVGQAEEVAGLILFLASDQSGWITGTTTPIDGGRHLTCAR